MSERFVPLSKLPPRMQAVYQDQAFATPFPYYSTVQLRAPLNGGGDAYELGAGQSVTAFSYAEGQDRTPAGYNALDGVATFADTNLSQAGQTISGENVQISGVAIQVMPRALVFDGESGTFLNIQPDADFLGALCQSMSIELGLNGGRETFQMGTLTMVPGAGGIIQGATRTTQNPGLQDAQSRPELFPVNGTPVVANNFKMKEGMVWRNQGNRDSTLAIIFRNGRNLSIPVEADRTGDNDPANVATGEAPWTAPALLAIELKIFLEGLVVGPRSDVT